MSEEQGGWSGGTSSPRISMERIDIALKADGDNWQDGAGDAAGAENSL